jgi:fucose permease
MEYCTSVTYEVAYAADADVRFFGEFVGRSAWLFSTLEANFLYEFCSFVSVTSFSMVSRTTNMLPIKSVDSWMHSCTMYLWYGCNINQGVRYLQLSPVFFCGPFNNGVRSR